MSDPASGLRHELRNLVNHVVGYTELVQGAFTYCWRRAGPWPAGR